MIKFTSYKKINNTIPSVSEATTTIRLMSVEDHAGCEGLINFDTSKAGESRIVVLNTTVHYISAGKSYETANIDELIASAVRNAMKDDNIKHVTIVITHALVPYVSDIIIGAKLGNYEFTYKSKRGNHAIDVTLEFPSEPMLSVNLKKNDGYNKALSTADSIIMARNLINTNAKDLTPDEFHRAIAGVCVTDTETQSEVTVVSDLPGSLVNPLITAVDPVSGMLVCAEYFGNDTSKDIIMLVGKGVTYDTGGLSLKPSSGMINMKTDMGGAAVILGVLQSVIESQPKINIKFVFPLATNEIGRGSLFPGDVIISSSGKSVFVGNTDAEGRLLLADAISTTLQCTKDDGMNVTAIVDIATLTGGALVALGNHIAPIMSNDNDFADAMIAHGENVNEKLWRMPVGGEYRKLLDTPLADISNMCSKPNGFASAVTAATFIKEFVPDEIPWAHIDIAGTSRTDIDNGITSTGGTGFGVRLLLDYIDSLTK